MSDPKSFFRLIVTLFVSVLCLTGCVHYDVEIAFDHQHHGFIQQHIQLGEEFTNFNQKEAQRWLSSIEKRGRQLQGQVKRISPQELDVKIPFHNGQELTKKFNLFFNPEGQNQNLSGDLDLVQLKSEMAIAQSNWIFFEREKINLDIDLRALGVLSQQGSLILSPGSLLDLDLSFQSPWGARVLPSSQGVQPPNTRKDGDRLIWTLEPGQLNHLEIALWTPSWIGLGALAIALLMLGGYYLKYQKLPGV